MNKRVCDKKGAGIACLMICILWGEASFGESNGPGFKFRDVTQAQGINPDHDGARRTSGSGASAADFDGDGYVDLFIPQATGYPDRLYHHLGKGCAENKGGCYVEIGADAGVDSTESGWAALWIDYDNDGDLDLFVAGTFQPGGEHRFRLYRNDSDDINGIHFENRTDDLPDLPLELVDGNWQVGGLCAGDINNDGHLDIYAALYGGGPAFLLLNKGDGTFEDISVSSGLATRDLHWQPVMADFNGDGWMDIFQIIDGSPNKLWINRRDNTFKNRVGAKKMARLAGIDGDRMGTDMGVTLGDYDNDGHLDIYMVQISEPGCCCPLPQHLFRNQSGEGDPADCIPGNPMIFVNEAESMGVESSGWGWGTTFFDADNDGYLDIASTNGTYAGRCATDQSRFFHNPGAVGGSFTDMSDAVGFNDILWGNGLMAFDFDRDGDLDLLQVATDSVIGDGPLRLLENDLRAPGECSANPNLCNHLVVKPRTNDLNRFAIGAIVRVEAGGETMMRLISAGTSFLSQEPAEAFFGLGAATYADSITVEWPDGTTTVCPDAMVCPDILVHELTIIKPANEDCNQGGSCRDNGLFCDGEEICDAVLGCVSTGHPCPPHMNCCELEDVCVGIISKRAAATTLRRPPRAESRRGRRTGK